MVLSFSFNQYFVSTNGLFSKKILKKNIRFGLMLTSPLSLLASSPLTGTQETILPRSASIFFILFMIIIILNISIIIVITILNIVYRWSKLRSVLLILCLESSRAPTKCCRFPSTLLPSSLSIIQSHHHQHNHHLNHFNSHHF